MSMLPNACCRPQTNDREEGLKKYNIVNERNTMFANACCPPQTNDREHSLKKRTMGDIGGSSGDNRNYPLLEEDTSSSSSEQE